MDLAAPKPAQDSPATRDWDASGELQKYIPQAYYNRRAFDRTFYRNLLFYCLAGDTKIPCLDGKERTMQEIAESATPTWIYGYDTDSLEVVPALMEHCWKTGEKPCVEVSFDEGTAVTLTEDHKLLTWKRGYVAAKDLLPGESLVPFMLNNTWDGNDVKRAYDAVLQPADGIYQRVHRLVADELWGIPEGHEVHHKNEDSHDNRPENLEVLSKTAHQRKTTAANWHKIGPALKKAQENRAAWEEKRKEGIRRYWQGNDAARARVSAMFKKLNATKKWKRGPKKREALPNHRVKSVLPVGVRGVYDANVPRTSNFALSAGVFAKNCGQQWIRYNRQNQQWRPINVPDWFPKQVTNKYAVAVDAMISVFAQSNPTVIYGPGNGGEESISASDTARDVSDVIDEEVGQTNIKNELQAWLVLTGNAFVIDDYDNSPAHGQKFVQFSGCLNCMAVVPPHEAAKGCPGCGGKNFIPAQGPQGPIGQNYPIGKMHSEVATPFEMHFDLMGGSFERSPYIFRARTYPIETLKDMFPDYADKIKEDAFTNDTGLFYQSAMAYVTNATATSPGNYGGSIGSVDNVKRGTLYHLLKRPSKDLPNGGEAFIINDMEVWKGELSKHDDRGNPIIPITHFYFKKVPGRIFGKTPADDLIHKQTQRNKIEALIQLAMERTSNPTWLLPKGIGINAITGEPGEKIWYNGFLQNLKPERLGGSELPGSVFRWIEYLDKDMEDLAATYDVLKGNTPKGVPTLGGTQMLLERGLSRFADGLENWGAGWLTVRRNRLMIWKEYAADERTRSILGPNSKWEIQKFSNLSISGNINVRLEAGSVQPRSKAYQQLITGQLIQAQLLDITDPELRLKILQRFDAGDLVEDLDLDVKDAIKEREEFLATGQVRPRPNIDNDKVHAERHIKDAKGDEYFSWPPQRQQAWVQHIMYHVQRLQQAAQQAMMQNPKMAAPMMKAQTDQQKALAEIQNGQQKAQLDTNTEQQKAGINLNALHTKKSIELEALGIKKQMELGAAQLKHKQSNGQIVPPS